MKKIFYKISLGVALIAAPNLYAQKHKTAFAIVIDQQHKDKLEVELDNYKKMLIKDGFQVFVLSQEWKSPESIKQELKKLYDTNHLEGAVFIGNIPVPMIRDAQHLTSTFKMPQNLDWIESSVPSDRYYDDFDLQFQFIKQDENQKHLFYYSLDKNSPQYIEMDIYSGRLKPPTTNFEESVQYLKKYLTKAVQQRSGYNPLNQITTYTAEGYNSNALNSWTSVIFGFRNQFANLFQQPNQVRFSSYNNQNFMKGYWMNELKNQEIDYAYFNGHGLADSQIMSGIPEVSSPTVSMDNVARYVRNQIRSTKEKGGDLDDKQAKLQEALGLNDKLFESIWQIETIKSDSLYDAQKNIVIKDLKNWDVNAQLVYLDACLNGSFQLDDYIAAYYPFSNGNNQVVFANSVGVLQDLWANELMGLIQVGTRVGQVLKHTAYLETHIFGDPSFHFTYDDANKWNMQVAHNKDSVFWAKQLNNSVTDVQALALNKLSKLLNKDQSVLLLTETFYDDPNENVRTEAFLLLKKIQPANWHSILIDALKDNHEYIRRIAVYEMGEIGDPVFIQPLVNLYFTDLSSNRTSFNVERMLDLFDKDLVVYAIEKERILHPLYNESIADNFMNKYKKGSFITDYFDKLKDSSLPEKDQKFVFSILRAYRLNQYIPEICAYIQNQNLTDEKLILALEGLSWFPKSLQKQHIITTCYNILDNDKYSNGVKEQAIRTIKLVSLSNE